MLRVSFEVNRDHLAYRLWFSEASALTSQLSFRELRRLIRSTYNGSAALDLFHANHTFRALNPLALRNQDKVEVIRDWADAAGILDTIEQSDTFRGQYTAATHAMQAIMAAWRRTEAIVEPYLANLSELGSDDFAYRVLVLPAVFNEGSYLGNQVVEWGYPDVYPAYSVVGIAHEILHGLSFGLAKTNDERWLLHGLIYLLADEELRMKLIPQSTPFDPSVTRHYDKRLTKVAERISASSAWKTRTDSMRLPEIFAEVRRELFERAHDHVAAA